MFKINCVAYHLMYDQLTNELWKKALDKDQQKQCKPDSALIWGKYVLNNKDQGTIFELICGEYRKDEDHLSKKLSDFPMSSGKLVPLHPGIFIKAVNYIGLTIPQIVIDNNVKLLKHNEVQAHVLYQLFLKTNVEDYYSENRDQFEVFDELSGKIKTTFFDRHGKPVVKIIDEKGKDIILHMTGYEAEKYELKQGIYNDITKYFDLLVQKDYRSAIEFWHPNARKMQTELDYLELFNRFFRVSKLELFDVSDRILKSEDKIEAGILYRAEISMRTSNDIRTIINATVGGHSNTADALKRFHSESKKYGFNISDTLIEDIYNLSTIEKLHYSKETEPQNLKALLPEVTVYRIMRFAYLKYEVSLDDNNNKDYLISEFTDIATYSIEEAEFIKNS